VALVLLLVSGRHQHLPAAGCVCHQHVSCHCRAHTFIGIARKRQLTAEFAVAAFAVGWLVVAGVTNQLWILLYPATALQQAAAACTHRKLTI
jgi:hypothetical protein